MPGLAGQILDCRGMKIVTGRHRTSGYGQASIACTVAQTFRRPFRIRNRPVYSHVEVSLLGQMRSLDDRRPRFGIGCSEVVGRAVTSNDCFSPCQRTAPDPLPTVMASQLKRPVLGSTGHSVGRTGRKDSRPPRSISAYSMMPRRTAFNSL